MTIEQLEIDFNKAKEKFIVLKSQKNQLMIQKEELIQRLDEISSEVSIKEKTAIVLQEAGDFARSQIKLQIETMVTNALKFVYRENKEFKINYEPKRGRPEAEFIVREIYEDRVVETAPDESNSGGLVDVISTTLRIALAECFEVEGPIILDEPTKFLSLDLVPHFANFLRQVAEQFNRQIIVVTQHATLAECGDLQYTVQKRNGFSHVSLIRSLI